MIFQKLKNYRRAGAEFAASTALNPRSPQAWNHLGARLRAVALLSFSLFLALSLPSSASARSLARSCNNFPFPPQNLALPPPKSSPSKTLAPPKQPSHHHRHHQTGLCSTSMGDIRDGVAAYERAVALSPDMKEAWINLAQARWAGFGGFWRAFGGFLKGF